MAPYEIEIILTRQWADCLSMPAFLTDTSGNLIFYNEPAEKLLGTRFEETGEMKVETWGTCFKQKDDDGNLIPPEKTTIGKNDTGSLSASQNIPDRKHEREN